MPAHPLLIAVLILLLVPSAPAVQAETFVHALAMSGAPKYPAGFDHFDYADPQAPKGGEMRLWALGSYDTFNPFLPKGVAAAGAGLVYDTLLTKSDDEPFTEYGLVARGVAVAEDGLSVAFALEPGARFHDGRPVTAQDVVFSFQTLTTVGSPVYKKYYADVSRVRAKDERTVVFELSRADNAELPLILGQLPVIPEHHWRDKDFASADLTEHLGSGPYRLLDFEPGRWVRYQRVEDYWGGGKGVNAGRHNVDIMRYDYFRDTTVAQQAFLSGAYDLRQENSAKNWATAYTGPAVDQGLILQETIPHGSNQGMQAFIYNLRRPLFKDKRVRRALAHGFDFEWSNTNLFHGQYQRTKSYFANSELSSRRSPDGLPSKAELKLLEPLRGQVPPEVFTEVYEPPTTDGDGNNRQGLRQALGLLQEAGWTVGPDKKLVNDKGEPMAFELLLSQASMERVALPFKKNLERLGVDMTVRMVDPNQYVNRVRSFDYDMIVGSIPQSESPGNEQRYFFHSDAADVPDTYNFMGLKDPAVDTLVEAVIRAEDRQTLVTACRALDRVLLHGHYVVPQFHLGAWRVAHWDKFGRPATAPTYALGADTWWVDPAKYARLKDSGLYPN